ncbi:pilus assembly protein [Atopomonas hussainii]|uniref:pilus assembly protein n=1 Tax=Atopomonas hussainii TaxID=1429083 RepID=UPI001C315403|nr:PilC/PilY family type IV pilus protein [Atopomonas hussainii]
MRPNIVFVIDTSGSMLSGVPGTQCKNITAGSANSKPSRNWCTNTNSKIKDNTSQQTRLQVVKEVVGQLADDLALSDDANIGLVRFDSSSNGGFVNIPSTRSKDIVGSFKTELNSYYGKGATPLLETYHEAALYLRGENPKYGNGSKGYIEDGTGLQEINPWRSAASSKSGSSYLSPITNSCQKSNIIVLTDGLPNNDSGSHSDIQSLVSSKNDIYKACRSYPSDGEAGAGCWMPGLAEYLANQDNSPLSGKQTISTYTIGFGNLSNTDLLQDTATLGGGKFFVSSNTSGLVDSLKSIVVDILAENTTFTTPTVSVSAYSNFGYRNDLYYALFRPADGARWLGNVKKYVLGTNSSGTTVILDQNGREAVDSSTGFFKETAQSYWSPSVDGKDAGLGGAASVLPNPSTRKIYTNVSSNNTLTANENSLTTSNSNVSKSLLGSSSMSDTVRSNIISWARGTNPADSSLRQQIADVLHNAPKVVAYLTDEDLTRAGTTNNAEELVLFFGTNEGFISAINAKTGVELFSFVPKELLGNLKAYYEDPKGSTNKRYGIDGQFDLRVSYSSTQNTNQTRPVSSAILYAGMRRGGRTYYALDVSPSSASTPATTIVPKVLWSITGGTTSGFSRLGQTWSTPKVAKVKWAGATKDVIIFTGGYDTNQDDDTPNTPSNDSVGNALYVVDATTGALLWMAGPATDTAANVKIASMTNSIPADPALIDLNGDGIIDKIFAADTRGQIFRFDLNSSTTNATNFATGGRIASFGGTNAQNNRRFYNKPDVALIKERGGKTFFTISIGSGYRAHPLNEDTLDRFYVIRDFDVYTTPSSYVTVTENDMVDASSVTLDAAATAAIEKQINDKRALITSLTDAETNQRNAFDNYKTGIGYTSKYSQLVSKNTDINRKQAEIDAILEREPFLINKTAEAQAQTNLHSLAINSQAQLKSIYNITSGLTASPTTEASNFLITQQDTSKASNAAVIQQWLTNLLDNSSSRSKLDEINTKRTDIITGRNNGQDVSDLETELATLNDQYADLDETKLRTKILNEQSSISSLISEISQLQLDIFNTLNATPAGDSSTMEASLTAKQSELVGKVYPDGVPGTLPTVDSSALANLDTNTRQTNLSNISTPLVADLNLYNTYEQQRTTLAGEASTLQAELQALADKLYDASSSLLTAEQLTLATAADSNPPFTQFDAYQYLIATAQADAASRIPTLRSEINALYVQLTPGDSYTPDTASLASSRGWFLRFPVGEKVLANSVSVQGNVLFTTFRPSGQQVTSCGPDVGLGRFYALKLTDASAVYSKTINGTKTYKRSIDINHAGIPPSPAIVLTGGSSGSPAVLVGAEVMDGDLGIKLPPVSTTYWREN